MPEVRAPSQPIMWPERGKGAVKLCQSIRGIPAGFIPPETSEYSPEGRRVGWGGGRFTIELGKRGSHATKATIERERHHFLKKKKKKPLFLFIIVIRHYRYFLEAAYFLRVERARQKSDSIYAKEQFYQYYHG